MDNFRYNSVLNYPSFRTGVSFFASSLLFFGIGKYMKLEAASNFVQLKAIVIATTIQATIHRCKEYNSEETDQNEYKGIYYEIFKEDINIKSWIQNHFFKVITPIFLAGLIARKSRFKRIIVSTSIIAGGCLGIDCLLSHKRPLRMKKEDFERKIVSRLNKVLH